VQILGESVFLPLVPIQDTVHLANKLRNPLIDRSLLLGKFQVSLAPLAAVLSSRTTSAQAEAQTGLRVRDLQPNRMDFRAAQRLFSLGTIKYVESMQLTGLAIYLSLARDAFTAFLEPGLHPYTRIERIYYAYYFTEGWLLDLKRRPLAGAPVRELFITQNAYRSLRLNADALLAYSWCYAAFPQFRRTTPFSPELLGSQACEEGFRDSRGDSHGNVNFDFVEFLHSLNRANAEQIIKAIQLRNGMQFPARNHKAWSFERRPSQPYYFPNDATAEGLLQHVFKARDRAIATLRQCDIVYTERLPTPTDDDLDIDLTTELQLLQPRNSEVRNKCGG